MDGFYTIITVDMPAFIWLLAPPGLVLLGMILGVFIERTHKRKGKHVKTGHVYETKQA